MNKILKSENFKVFGFFALLSIVLTWPAAWHFFNSVPSLGSDTMQVIGVAGERANLLRESGIIKGTFELLRRSEFNIVTLYAFFELIFGRIAGYNILFFLSFTLSGLGAYLLAKHFINNKPAALLAGIIFAFSPFHVHNSLSTNVGTMHQEWLPFFALYLFKFFEDLKFKHFALTGLFLLLIAFTEHQLLAFTLFFILIFLLYKVFSGPQVFLQAKFWAYAVPSVILLSVMFFFMFRSLLTIAGSEHNFLDPGFKATVKYSNDALSILIPPPFHSLWPDAFSGLRSQFERKTDSTFSAYAGFTVLLLTFFGIIYSVYLRIKKNNVRKQDISQNAGKVQSGRVYGFGFWAITALVFYVLSLGPYLHYKGVIDPPVKMPYFLVYNYLPYYNNIRTVGRFFVWSMLSFALTAAYGINYLKMLWGKGKDEAIISRGEVNKTPSGAAGKTRKYALYYLVGAIIILEFLAVPLKTNTLLHSSFYEKLGADSGQYSILEIPGNTDYDFASRSLVWRSIHRKQTVNGYDFARANEDNYIFQRGTPIIRTLLYDIPEGDDKRSDRDIMKDSYYKMSDEILNYYNIRYVILDREGLRGDPKKDEPDKYYAARAYLENVVQCANVYEDAFLYACEVNKSAVPQHMFVAMDYANKHWVGKDRGKEGIRRWAENGAGVKIVNMGQAPQDGKFNFKVKLYKPLRIKASLNGETIYDKYISQISEKTYIETSAKNIKPGENDVVFNVFAADGSEIHSEKKSDVATIYDVEIE